jgi:hypothetical protein
MYLCTSAVTTQGLAQSFMSHWRPQLIPCPYTVGNRSVVDREMFLELD